LPRCFFHRNWRWRSSRNRGRSWSAPARLDSPNKANRSRCQPTATPPSWAGLATTRGEGGGAGFGAAWVYARSGGIWTQLGGKLVGTGAVGNARQGWSVALSADGNTALVGGPYDNEQTGAAWVYTRNGGLWAQQGGKLVGSGAVGAPYQGWSVALSDDGNTAVVGGPYDNSSIGGAWAYARSNGVWTQQGNKLVGTGAVQVTSVAAAQGSSAALSGDGNTAIVGGPFDNSNAGAAWVWTRTSGVWTQQGSKLVGTGAVKNAAEQGWSVALSADGNSAIVGAIAAASALQWV
jgi:hypothetical protein